MPNDVTWKAPLNCLMLAWKLAEYGLILGRRACNSIGGTWCGVDSPFHCCSTSLDILPSTSMLHSGHTWMTSHLWRWMHLQHNQSLSDSWRQYFLVNSCQASGGLLSNALLHGLCCTCVCHQWTVGVLPSIVRSGPIYVFCYGSECHLRAVMLLSCWTMLCGFLFYGICLEFAICLLLQVTMLTGSLAITIGRSLGFSFYWRLSGTW